MLPIGVAEQLSYCILQVRPVKKDLLQALQYALLASICCKQCLHQMGGSFDLQGLHEQTKLISQSNL